MIDGNINLKNKRCVVTGGTGFIGSHLCSYLYKKGAEVWNIDIEPPREGTLFSILNNAKKINTYANDLSQTSSIGKVKELKPSIIFHLAAEPYAPFTTCNPSCAFQANVVTTANMLEAARETEGCQFIFASSACFFGATSSSPLLINSKISKPEHYYSYTKRMAEDLVRSYIELYGIDASICRFSNIYGPGDRHFGRIVPSICRQLIVENSISLDLARSKGESVFEFLHVDDAVEGIYSAATLRNRQAEEIIYHFSGGISGRKKVSELVKRLSEIYDQKKRIVCVGANANERTVIKYLDFEMSRTELGWVPQRALDEGLRETILWYQEHLNKLSEK